MAFQFTNFVDKRKLYFHIAKYFSVVSFPIKPFITFNSEDETISHAKAYGVMLLLGMLLI